MLKRHISLFLMIFVACAITGCGTTTANSSKLISKPAEFVTKFKLVYFPSDFTTFSYKRGEAARNTGKNALLQSLGYGEVGEIIKKRAPIVFTTQKLEVDAVIVTSPMEYQKAIESLDPRTKVITLTYVGGPVNEQNITMGLKASVIDSTNRKTMWTGDFVSIVSATHFGKFGFDDAYVDAMLNSILRKLREDEITPWK